MTPQTFAVSDIGVVGFLILLEGLLSADNALVLALMVRHLPRPLQRKALLYGLGGAFVFRLGAILLAATLIGLWWVQALGAAYLLYLPLKHFFAHATNEGKKVVGKGGFWRTVIAVELADIAFAIDSVLAAVAMVNLSRHPDKLWVVYFGAVVGLILLRFAAGVFIRLLERFPRLDHLAYTLVGWVGIKLVLMAGENYQEAIGGTGIFPFQIHEMSKPFFWTVMVIIVVVGTIIALHQPADPAKVESLPDIFAKEDETTPTPNDETQRTGSSNK